MTRWAVSVCARCPCPLGAVLPLPALSEAVWKHLVCARCALSVFSVGVQHALSQLRATVPCQPINLQSTRTPWLPGHCCWVMCFQVINDTIEFSRDSLLFLCSMKAAALPWLSRDSPVVSLQLARIRDTVHCRALSATSTC